MKKSLLLSMMVVLLSLVGCQEEVEFLNPSVTVTPDGVGETSLSFKITPEDAKACSYVCIEANAEVPTAEAILQSGKQADAAAESVQTVENLQPSTRYTIVAAVEANGIKIASRSISMTTAVTPSPDANPQVKLSALEKKSDSFSFRAEPSEAVKCSYVCIKAGDKAPAAAEIIANGKRILPNEVSEQVETGLKDGTDYVVVAAVQNGEKFNTAELKISTTKGGVTEFVADKAKGRKGVASNFFVQLMNYQNTVALDFYAPEGSETLPAGTYEFSEDKADFVIWSTTSTFGNEDVFTTFVDGKATVALEGEIYTISFDLTQANGEKLTGTYTGEIEGMFVEFPSYDRICDLPITKIKAKHYGGEAMLTITLGEDQYRISYDMYFTAPSGKVIPFGDYHVEDRADTEADGTKYITKFANIKDMATGIEDQFVPGEGLVNVDINADNQWVITIDSMLTKSFLVYSNEYVGPIEGLDTPKQREVLEFNVTNLTCSAYGMDDGTRVYSISCADDNWVFWADMRIQIPQTDKYLMPGTYNYGEGANTFKIGGGFYIYQPIFDQVNGEGGTLEVSLDGKEYTLAFSIIDDRDRIVKMNYTGLIPNMISPDLSKLKITNAELFYHYETNAKVQFFFNDEYRLDIDFNMPEGTSKTEIALGTYPVKWVPYDEDNKFTVGPSGSSLTDLALNASQSFNDGKGSVEVRVEDNQWVFDIKGLETAFGCEVNSYFKGSVKGLLIPGAEPVEHIYSPFEYVGFEKFSSPYLGYTVKFKAPNDLHELTYSFLCAKPQLQPDTYSLEAHTLIDPTLVGPTIPGFFEPFTPMAAEAEVTLDGEIYTFNVSWTSIDGTINKGTWTGEMPGMFEETLSYEYKDLELLSMQRTADPGFTLVFESLNQGFDFTYTFASSDKQLQPGEYVLSKGTLIQPTFIEDFSPWGGQFQPADAKAKVELDGEVYTIFITWDDGAGHIQGGEWTGKIPGMFGSAEAEDWNITRVKAKHLGSESIITIFTGDENDSNIVLDLKFPYQKDKTQLPQQEYLPGNMYDSNHPEYCLHQYSCLRNKDTGDEDSFTPLKGKAVISSEGGDWVIQLIDVEAASGRVINLTYKGQIENLDAPAN